MSKEFGQIADGFPGKFQKGTNTIRFFTRNNIPVGRIVTCSQIVVGVRPQKEEPIQVLLTVGGNCIEYTVKVSTKTVDLTTFNIHINSVISTIGAKYAGWDIGNYYLETPIGRS